MIIFTAFVILIGGRIAESVKLRSLISFCAKLTNIAGDKILSPTFSIVPIFLILIVYSSECFMKYAVHKFRSTIGKAQSVKPNDKILLAYSGGTILFRCFIIIIFLLIK